MLKRLKLRTVARRGGALLAAGLILTSCGWKGIANVPMPGGVEGGKGTMTLYVQMPDTLALNVNSRVRVADVFVGSVRAIELKNWVATLTLDVQSDLKLPSNTLAKIGQTSLLGSQHVELDPPKDPSAQVLKNGDTIPLQNSSSFPTTERVLASIGTILTGGGIPNLETIQTEINNILSGRGDQIREFLGRLDTFTRELNAQRQDIVRAIDSTNRLLAIVAQRNDTLDLFADAVTALGRISKAADDTLSQANPDIHTNLQNLQRPLVQLGKAGPYVIGALKLLFTAPFSIENVPKVVRGDYINVSANIDLTLSAIDNGFLTGTGVSGMLRALEQ